MTISGRPVEIYALLGGQWPHSSYMVPGGVMCAPTLTDVTRAWSHPRVLQDATGSSRSGSAARSSATSRSSPTTISWPGSTNARARQLRPRLYLADGPGRRARQVRRRHRQVRHLGLPAARGQVQEADDRRPQRRGDHEERRLRRQDRHAQADGPEVRARGHAARLVRRSRGGQHPFDRTTKPIAEEHDRLRPASTRGRRRFAMPRTAGWRPDRSRAS